MNCASLGYGSCTDRIKIDTEKNQRKSKKINGKSLENQWKNQWKINGKSMKNQWKINR